MRTPSKRIGIFALAVIALVAQANAAVTFTPGDLILAFRATGSSYMVNLGAATVYRDATADIGNIVTVKTDLDNHFPGWENRSDVTWGIFGVRSTSQVSGVVNGDPGQTIYVSRAESPIGIQETAWGVAGQNISSTDLTNAAFNMMGVQIEFAGGTPTGIANATVLSDAQTTYDILGSTWMAFTNGGGTRGNFGSGTNGTALDLFRVLGTLIGADPTGLLRVGSYEGTFHITDAGVVSYTAAPTASAVPEPSHLVFLSLGVIGVIYRRRRTH
jgi:hypothetical protein